MGASTTNIPTLSNEIFAALTASDTIEITLPDLTTPEFTIPEGTGEVGGAAPQPLTEADLTSRRVGGSGMFDGLMATVHSHLAAEFKAGRITGELFAKATIEMAQAAMGNAVQYLLGRDQAHWTGRLVSAQARAAEIAIIGARVELEKQKVQLKEVALSAKIAQANLTLAKAKLATEEAQYDHLRAQTRALEKDIEKATYEVTHLLPLQKSTMEGQILAVEADTSHKSAQTANVNYQTTTLLPAQKIGVDKDNATKQFTVEFLMPLQKESLEHDNTAKLYNIEHMLPEQLHGLEEQNEAHRAKTLSTRSDGVTPVAGAIGKQMALQEQQITSFKRDAETKMAKILGDIWVTQKSLDEGLEPPLAFTDTKINTTFDTLAENLYLVTPPPAPEEDE